MKKLRFCSDIHLEFDGGQRPLHEDQIKARGPGEILMVAGDLVPSDYLRHARNDANARSLKNRMLQFLEDVYDYEHVYFIGGNHDSYQSDILKTYDIFNEFLLQQGIDYTHMRFVEDAAIELVSGTWLLTCTLWTDMNKGNPVTMEAVRGGMNDFHVIKKGDRVFTPQDAMDIHQRSLNHLAENYRYFTTDYEKREADGKTKIIVATHHAPSFQSVRNSERHGGEIDFGYFSDLDEWVLNRPQITHWLHGHTHDNCRYEIGNTQVMVNCRGYGMRNYEDRCFKDFSVDNGVIELEEEDNDTCQTANSQMMQTISSP